MRNTHRSHGSVVIINDNGRCFLAAGKQWLRWSSQLLYMEVLGTAVLHKLVMTHKQSWKLQGLGAKMPPKCP